MVVSTFGVVGVVGATGGVTGGTGAGGVVVGAGVIGGTPLSQAGCETGGAICCVKLAGVLTTGGTHSVVCVACVRT